METALTPLEFARRARALYAERLAVVDGDLRLTYAQFFVAELPKTATGKIQKYVLRGGRAGITAQ